MIVVRDQEIVRMREMFKELKNGERDAAELEIASTGAVRFGVRAKVEMEIPDAVTSTSTSLNLVQSESA